MYFCPLIFCAYSLYSVPFSKSMCRWSLSVSYYSAHISSEYPKGFAISLLCQLCQFPFKTWCMASRVPVCILVCILCILCHLVNPYSCDPFLILLLLKCQLRISQGNFPTKGVSLEACAISAHILCIQKMCQTVWCFVPISSVAWELPIIPGSYRDFSQWCIVEESLHNLFISKWERERELLVT